MPTREKKHRLPLEYYRGKAVVSFSICLKNRVCLFNDSEIVKGFIAILKDVINSEECLVPVYCFMPDHLHLLIIGLTDNADLLKIVAKFKQKTGYWLAGQKKEAGWQKDFYDQVIRTNDSINAHIRYILDNPVRKGIVDLWPDYPHIGSIGCELNDILASMD
jgi:putative transposase